MKRIRNIGFFVLMTLVLIVFLLPKRQLYYQAEALMQPYGVVVSGEFVNDSGFGLQLEDGTLYYGDLEVAVLNEVSVKPWLFYNSMSVAPFTFSDAMQQFLPGTVDALSISYTLFWPLQVRLHADGEFGELQGSVDLLNRHVQLTLHPSAQLLERRPIWMNELKKAPSGEYTYEVAY